ncbi:MAG: hypothetical protein JKY48_14230 [Flavobacteriales bacterium]|nr:hypothetical protein [Flavobacteriales bacterium]
MRTIAHIVNPFIAASSSDLSWAQPITFESMRRARRKARDYVDVKLYSAQFKEDRSIVPESFLKTNDLERSVLDLETFKTKLKLPIIGDILNRLYQESEAEYLIYTNIDIGLYPDFYLKVNQFIDRGYDAFIINRRRLTDELNRVDELEKIYGEKGRSHPGFDCFVFHRDLFPHFQLADICIGVPFIGITLSQNLFAVAKNFQLFEEEKLSFHLGEEIFAKRAPKEYFKYNQKQFWKAMNSELKKELDIRKFPYSKQNYFVRWIKWGLQPSIPIRLAIKLEYKRIFSAKS